MNPDQVKSIVTQAAAILGGVALAVGVIDQAQATQLTSEVMTVVNAGIAIVGAVAAIGSLVSGIWKHTHANQIKAAAGSIAATGDIQTLAPVMTALKDAGATVVPGPLMPPTPNSEPSKVAGVF